MGDQGRKLKCTKVIMIYWLVLYFRRGVQLLGLIRLSSGHFVHVLVMQFQLQNQLYFCHYLQKLMVCNVFYLPLMWPTDALWKVNLGQCVWYKQKAHLWPSAGMWLLSKGFLQLTVLFTKPLDCVPLAGMLFREQSPIHGQWTIFLFCMEWLVTMELVALWISL